MDRLFVNIFLLLFLGYFLGVVFSQKTLSSFFWILKKFEGPSEFVRSWLDIIYAFASILFLGFLAYSYWPLSNEDSQLLIFLVTGFALFFQAVISDRPHKHRNRPIIDVEFIDKESTCFHKTVTNVRSEKIENNQYSFAQSSVDTYYIRLKILNKGEEMLKNVEGVVEAVDPESGNPFLPLSLNWSFLKETDPVLARYAEIPQDMFRALDVLEIHNPLQVKNYADHLKQNNFPDANRYTELSKAFRSCTLKPTALSDVYPYGEYDLFLGIYAENAKPLFIKLTVNYRSKDVWNGDIKIMRKRLNIKMKKSYNRSVIHS